MNATYKFKDARKACGLTQREVASVLKTTPATYSRYENGLIQPDSQTLTKIAKLFGVSVDYLLGNDAPCQVASPNGNHNTVTTGDIHISQATPLRGEQEKLLSVYDSLDDVSKTQLMSVAYMLMSASLKARGVDVQQMVEQQLDKLKNEKTHP